MTRVLYTADLHFNHPKVAEYRGYTDPEQHDRELIERINDTTVKRDHLWILGDLGLGSLTRILEKCAQLKPELHLVFGNHDAGHPLHRKAPSQQRRYLDVFESVHLHSMHRVGDQRFLLSHFPYDGDHTGVDRHSQWRLRDEGMYLVHGHVHNEWLLRGRQFNVGVDLTPEPVDRIHILRSMKILDEGGTL